MSEPDFSFDSDNFTSLPVIMEHSEERKIDNIPVNRIFYNDRI